MPTSVGDPRQGGQARPRPRGARARCQLLGAPACPRAAGPSGRPRAASCPARTIVSRITTAVTKMIRSRSGNALRRATVAGTARAVASDTAPRKPAQPRDDALPPPDAPRALHRRAVDACGSRNGARCTHTRRVPITTAVIATAIQTARRGPAVEVLHRPGNCSPTSTNSAAVDQERGQVPERVRLQPGPGADDPRARVGQHQAGDDDGDAPRWRARSRRAGTRANGVSTLSAPSRSGSSSWRRTSTTSPLTAARRRYRRRRSRRTARTTRQPRLGSRADRARRRPPRTATSAVPSLIRLSARSVVRVRRGISSPVRPPPPRRWARAPRRAPRPAARGPCPAPAPRTTPPPSSRSPARRWTAR